jgi:hypothetical protein
MDPATLALDAARRELLDLGLRNPLLNYRPLAARGLTIVDERPFPIYQHLVATSRAFTFLPASANGDPKTGQPPETNAVRHHDDHLQTPYADAELQKRLLITHDAAREYIEERGVNVLYLALGRLRWRERPAAPDRHAPLLLVPVELLRDDAGSRFRLQHTGADVGDNAALRAKLTLDFALELPPLPAEEALDLPAYFAAIRHAVQQMDDWAVDDTAVTLGFFSFSKLLMVDDLAPANWPAAQSPAAHPLLHALLARHDLPQPAPPLAADAPIDDLLPLAQSWRVVEADSTQALAILDVNAGLNLVIQGPPGTGKSQTITNLIAEALGNGRTVLFVAEKMAALDVVKRRLDEVGLGDAALALHSPKTTKSAFVAELGRTLRLGQPKDDGRFAPLSQFQTIRSHLNAYSAALNEPIGDSGLSLHEAYGRYLTLQARLADQSPPPLAIPGLADWSAAQFAARAIEVEAFQRILAEIGVPMQHPFWGSQRQHSPDDLPAQVRGLARQARESLRQIEAEAARLAAMLNTAVPPTFAALNNLQLSVQRLQFVPQLHGIQANHPAWATDGAALLAALEAGERIQQAHAAYDDWLIPDAWEQAALPIRQGLMAGRNPLARLLSPAYRRALTQLAGLCRAAPPKAWAEQIALVDAILDVQRLQPTLAVMAAPLAAIFGLHWRGPDSRWPDLVTAGGWLAAVHEGVRQGVYPASLPGLAAGAVDKAALQTAVLTLTIARTDYETAVATLFDHLQLATAVAFGPEQPFLGRPLAAQQNWLHSAQAAAETLPAFVAANREMAQLTAVGLQPLVEVAQTWPAAAVHLGDWLTLARCAALIHKANAQHAALSGYNGQPPDATIAQFCDLDNQFLAANRARLAAAHWQQLPRYKAGGQMGLLHAEIEKKRHHRPIRQLMQQAGRAIQRIKPVFMMSPLSIAAYLPPGSVQFDLVIFDEASQVRPVDAFGAIVRGRQVVVVGDSRQLPPTTFFERLAGNDGDTAVGGIAVGGAAVADDETDAPPDLAPNHESILDLFCAQNAPQQMLRWHYRSRHESLIALSNHLFYDRQLVIFPSPDGGRREVGLRYHYLPHTVYERGKSRANPLEAEAVARAVLQHAAAQPHLTLGVVAFSRSQQQAIRQAVEALRRQNPATEPFFRAHPTEPFFVKNLENVQGDERDVILISIGYGRAADGHLTLNFGPLNQTGGERRLNVLTTRARARCELFTNLTPEDIEQRYPDAAGVVALQRFLRYAATGELADLPPDTAVPPSSFAQLLAADLRAQGRTVVERVGSGPAGIDVAVVGEGENGRYTLGVVTDGPSYHQARSAHDRDRIQAAVLARLGWRIHRVWSQPWWLDANGERQRLLTAVADPPAPLPAMSVPLYERYDPADIVAAPRPIPAYQTAVLTINLKGRSFAAYQAEKKPPFRQNLLDWLAEVVAQEGPVHRTEAMRRLSYAAGYQMLTMPEAVERWLLKEGVKNGRIARRGDFLWPVGRDEAAVRDRSNLPPVSRKFEYICPEEIEAAVCLAAADAIGMALEEIPHFVGQLFGFRQIGEGSKTAVFAAIERLVADGRLQTTGADLYLATTSRVQ